LGEPNYYHSLFLRVCEIKIFYLFSFYLYLSLGRPRLAARLANSCMAFRMFSAVESSVEASSSSAATTKKCNFTYFSRINSPVVIYDSRILLNIYTGEENPARKQIQYLTI
jgi:hypothetical protein